MPESAAASRRVRFVEDADSTPWELYSEPRWYACRTRARAEKKVDALLEGSGVQSYLPLVEQEREWADRRKRVAFPLFPGYVFARFTLGEIHDVLKVRGVVTVVRNNGHPTPVREEEINCVRKLAEGVNETGVLPLAADFLEPGQRVVVTGGPFEGMTGVLLEERGRTRVVIRVSAIRQALSVQLDRGCLRPLRA